MNDTKTLIAFHGRPELKETMLARVRGHRKADEIIHGLYWQGGKGCAVGCTLHGLEFEGSYHAAYESELGIPRVLAKLEDGIFEGTDNGFAQAWPERFLEAIPVGADLSGVADRFFLALLVDPAGGVLRHAGKEKTRAAIEGVAVLYRRRISGETVTIEEWQAARSASSAAAAAASAAAAAAAAYASAAADASAAAAAYAAADADASAASAYASAAAYAAADADASAASAYASAAAYASADADASAAYASADASADARAEIRLVARKKARVWQGELLLQLMASAPVLQAA